MPSRESCGNKGKPSKPEFNAFGRCFVMASLIINSLLAHIDDLKIFMSSSKLDVYAYAWYRPPSSQKEIVKRFENPVDKIDLERKDFYLLGGLNCDMLHDRSNNHTSSHLTNIFDIYGLCQMISEPTRITLISRTLIGLGSSWY